MRRKRISAVLSLLLGGAVFLGAEVALDEVVQAGRFVLYRDHADPHKYYYVPDAPRLATKRDGTPEFTFLKYSKTDGTTKGGIIHFLVTWGLTEGELSSAESALRLKDPEAKVAGPVPFKEGTFKVVSATAGEGGLFNRRIVGEGKAPIMPGQKAAVSIALSEEGASLLWESFKNPTSDISVMFDLKFAGITPAFQAKLKVNWDKVYTQHDIKLHAEGTIKVVKIEADVRAILEELRQQGAIQLEVVGENENMQKMLDAVYTHLLSLMCEKVPLGPGEAASPASKTKPPATNEPSPALVADWSGGYPAWSRGVLADLVRSTEERLRGGPLSDQEQVQAGRETECSPEDRQRADSLGRRAAAFLFDKDYRQAIGLYEKANAACPDPKFLFEIATIYDQRLYEFETARNFYGQFLEKTAAKGSYDEQRATAQQRISITLQAAEHYKKGIEAYDNDKLEAAAEEFLAAFELNHHPLLLFNLAQCWYSIADQYDKDKKENFKKALKYYEMLVEQAPTLPEGIIDRETLNESVKAIEDVKAKIAALPDTAPAQQQTTSTSAQTGGTTKPPTGQTAATGGQAQQQTTSGSGTKPPDTGGGGKPPSGQQTTSQQGVKPPDLSGGKKPSSEKTAPEVKPIVSVQIGYSFKRVKLSGNYEVDLRKRLREDRDIVMSGNIGGLYQRYGEDPRFFTVVSLDDPTFQERSVEVILDGQDASDFKGYVNSVSVLFRKQRFSGAPMTGEVKFFDEQFARSGNRLSFKYGRLNEASTEWLDYEYKSKWSFYGGVEWEGEWTKTSDSVLTLTPPVRRRTLEISVDEDNILKNNVKALAVQVRHRIYGQDVLKEVVINYDKGDPLQADYTYMHEEGKLGYSYKVVWLFLDGREIQTDWTAKESPFIYAVYAKR